MRIISYMVVHNEVDRYLRQSIASVLENVDDLFIYDDRSDDGTFELLKELKVTFLTRPASLPSFVENEADFRNQAWTSMEKLFRPRSGEWVLTLDADEVIRTKVPLVDICKAQEDAGNVAAWMHIHEMWSPDQIRTDGWWPDTKGMRLAAYSAGGSFRRFEHHQYGGGSLPILDGPVGATTDADILHYGYALERDRQAKYQRYHGTLGHNLRHINSILQTPTLAQLPPLI